MVSKLFEKEVFRQLYSYLTENPVLPKYVPIRIGTILEPLLILLHTNDLPNCLKSTTPGTYAVDTQIFSSSDDAIKFVVTLNSDLADS